MPLRCVFLVFLSIANASSGRHDLFENLPASVDWRNESIISTVKDQNVLPQQCDSSYIFSAIGAFEGAWALKYGFIALSVQNILDCNKTLGCGGGDPVEVFNFIKKQGGIESENECPYEGVDTNSCTYEPLKSVAQGLLNVTTLEDEDSLLEAVANIGPISACFRAGGSFFSYSWGIWDPAPGECSHKISQCVLIVGYGTENNTPYWIAKNSFGKNWGEDGYIRIVRGKNACSIANNASFPIVR